MHSDRKLLSSILRVVSCRGSFYTGGYHVVYYCDRLYYNIIVHNVHTFNYDLKNDGVNTIFLCIGRKFTLLQVDYYKHTVDLLFGGFTAVHYGCIVRNLNFFLSLDNSSVEYYICQIYKETRYLFSGRIFTWMRCMLVRYRDERLCAVVVL